MSLVLFFCMFGDKFLGFTILLVDLWTGSHCSEGFFEKMTSPVIMLELILSSRTAKKAMVGTRKFWHIVLT